VRCVVKPKNDKEIKIGERIGWGMDKNKNKNKIK
jgi:hypothetical protein